MSWPATFLTGEMPHHAPHAPSALAQHRHIGRAWCGFAVLASAVQAPHAERQQNPAQSQHLLRDIYFSTFCACSADKRAGREAAAGIALINSLGALGGAIGPVLIGALPCCHEQSVQDMHVACNAPSLPQEQPWMRQC